MSGRVLLVWLGLLSAGTVHGVSVSTKYGDVQGQTWLLHNNKSVNSFLAIPFAKPPIGNLRWEKPEEPEPWTDEFVADTLGPACPQEPIGVLWLTHLLWDRFDESCLHLNIYAPTDTSSGPYPVMIWFHGGAFQSSANIQYPGYFLAAKDVVVVVPNYRLGALGFASTGDDVASGNYGLWDQNLAMTFVQENIAQFGGDPNKVTIFGQSAGAASTGLHIVSPVSQGMFHSAIYQSGSEVAVWSLNYPESNPEGYILQVAEQLDCPTDMGSQEVINCLREKPFDSVRETTFDCSPGYFCLGFAPVVDGEGGFIPDVPHNLRADGKYARVPVMAGHTDKDGSFFTLGFVPEAIDGGFTNSEFNAILRDRLVGLFAPRFANNKTSEDVFQALSFQYTPWPHQDDTETDDQNRQAINDILTDGAFGFTGDAVYKLHARENDLYYFILSRRPTNAEQLLPEWMGVPHNGDLPYVFGYSLLRKNEFLREEAEMYYDVIDFDEEDDKYTEYILELWANFAKTGNPTPSPVMGPDGRSTVWPRYDEEGQRYLDIGDDVRDDMSEYRQSYMAFWQKYIAYVSGIDTVLHADVARDVDRLKSDHVMGGLNSFISTRVRQELSRRQN